MENIITWILAVTSILYNQVVSSDYSNDFEVFHTSGSSGGLKSQSLYSQPMSSDDRRFTRNAFEPESVSDYVGSHNAFLWKYFDIAADYKIHERNDDDDRHEKTNDKYQQAPDVEQFDEVDHYDRAYNNNHYDHIRSLEYKQNQESQRNPENCKMIVLKGGMKCSVCKDSAGTHSKLCSRSSAPGNQKYEHVKQRMAAYKSVDDDEE